MRRLKIRKGWFLIIPLIIMNIIILDGCSAQKYHHKSVPCPCEKNKR